MNVKILAGVGIAALAVTSGNQARRHQRQGKSAPNKPKSRDVKRVRPPVTQTQDSSMYHDEVAELAAGISSYRYGAQLPGYMT